MEKEMHFSILLFYLHLLFVHSFSQSSHFLNTLVHAVFSFLVYILLNMPFILFFKNMPFKYHLYLFFFVSPVFVFVCLIFWAVGPVWFIFLFVSILFSKQFLPL